MPSFFIAGLLLDCDTYLDNLRHVVLHFWVKSSLFISISLFCTEVNDVLVDMVDAMDALDTHIVKGVTLGLPRYITQPDGGLEAIMPQAVNRTYTQNELTHQIDYIMYNW